MTHRAKHLAVAVLSGLVGRVVGLLTPLIVMGPMLQHLGPSLFGIWLTAIALTTMGAFLDFGVGNAAMTRLSEAFGQNDLFAVRRILGEAYALLLCISGVFLLGVLVAYRLAGWISPEASASGQAAVFAVVLSAMFLSFPVGLVSRLLQARHAFVHAQLAQVTCPMISLVACLSSISAGALPVTVIALYALTPPATLLVWTLWFFLCNPRLRPDFRGIRGSSLRSLLTLGAAFFSLSIFTLIGMNADNVILAARASAEVVADYGVPAKLGGILMLVVGTLFMPLWPMFGNALAQEDRSWLRATTLRMAMGGSIAVLTIGLSMTAFADPIMKAWMGRAFADQHLILLGWTVAATVIAFTAPFNMVLNAAGLARPQILPWAVFVIVSIGAKVFLLTAKTAWWAPWITAAVYFLTVTPRMILLARRELSSGLTEHNEKSTVVASAIVEK